ncbi:uncharacterized protein SRS1_11141 [Sporisorium reilianum f. sp. reilianum]|uniref:Uncharacterized protein n=1 Tax=Sporisorium reilianum f. sp. reilianum TaxID=72559 RepID=A0A2N8UFT2_9BASI|nr:uncharacterized protein SRS1_11141 [Sporisorium reilianum f. sp. reilianum]
MNRMERDLIELAAEAELPDSIPLASAAERAVYDVAKGTQALFGIFLECMLDAHTHKDSQTHKIDSSKRFNEAGWVWWRMTGGWTRVDKSIRDQYPPAFKDSISMLNERIPKLSQRSKAAASQSSEASSSKPAASKPSIRRRPFNTVDATRALYKVAQRSFSPSTIPPYVIEAVFDHLNKIWWEETGGPKHVDKSILAPYPSWFLGKLNFPRQNPAVGDNEMPKFDVQQETNKLFELAKCRLPNAPRDTRNASASFQLKMQFLMFAHHWHNSTGGWNNIDKAIRDQYPKWFVDEMYQLSIAIPMGKAMAFEGWNKSGFA